MIESILFIIWLLLVICGFVFEFNNNNNNIKSQFWFWFFGRILGV